jgi:BirA family biotin operon repressor/biotin-[acetyl-CoA-carboxylase] ligase
VAIVRGVRSLFPDIALQIKWPNDIYFQSAKVGGILCEGTSSFIVIGIGLNCVKAPQGLDQATTGLSQIHAGDPVVADQIRMPIVQALTEEFDHLIQNGPNRISQLYQAWAALPSGTPIQWGKSVEQQGWVETLGASGELLVKDKNGATIRLFAEDVSVRRITS